MARVTCLQSSDLIFQHIYFLLVLHSNSSLETGRKLHLVSFINSLDAERRLPKKNQLIQIVWDMTCLHLLACIPPKRYGLYAFWKTIERNDQGLDWHKYFTDSDTFCFLSSYVTYFLDSMTGNPGQNTPVAMAMIEVLPLLEHVFCAHIHSWH